MKQTPVTAVLDAMKAEKSALRSFITLLEQEQGILVENRTEQLLELSNRKTAAAIQLNDIAESRRQQLQKEISQPLTIAAINTWLAKNSMEGLSAWHEVLTLTARARELNQLNGQLIQTKLRHNQQALAVLSNAANKANLYGPDGQPSFAPGTGRSLGSG